MPSISLEYVDTTASFGREEKTYPLQREWRTQFTEWTKLSLAHEFSQQITKK